MTLKYSMEDLETYSRWQGSHTKHIVEVLKWDGLPTNGGTAYVRTALEGPYPYSYKVMNLVDLLQVYNPLPNLPKAHEIYFSKTSSVVVRIHEVALHEQYEDRSWIIYYDEDVDSGKDSVFYARNWGVFQKFFTVKKG